MLWRKPPWRSVKSDITPEEAALVTRYRAGTAGELFKEQRQERSDTARATQSGATGRGRGPKSSMPEETGTSEKFNIKKFLNLGNKKAQKKYVEACEPGSIPEGVLD